MRLFAWVQSNKMNADQKEIAQKIVKSLTEEEKVKLIKLFSQIHSLKEA